MPTLDFKGKQIVYSHHLTVPSRVLDTDAKKSLPPKGKKPSLDDNLIIHGDNLHALKALMPRYGGRVNCIYIDPPYNTGNEGWVYNDNVNSPMMKDWLENKNSVDGEDLERHDKWLCMMWPRLNLLRDLLAEDGVVFVSIDDNEQHNLRLIMNEIWGEENFVASIVRRRRKSQANLSKDIAVIHEYLFVYRKSELFRVNKLIGEVNEDSYRNPDNDPRGPYVTMPCTNKGGSIYKIVTPTGKSYRDEWRFKKSTFNSLLTDKKIVFPNKGNGKPRYKLFLSEKKARGVLPNSWWDNISSNQEATLELANILSKTDSFSNPKPSQLIQTIVALATHKDAVILDSFAGSGTTAHAVLALNKEDGGSRKFILVECEDKIVNKITAERVRRVIKGIPKTKDESLKKGLGGSFTYCTLGDEVNAENMLTGKNLPNYETLAQHLYWTATGQSADKIRKSRGKDGFFFETKDRLFYLIYEPKPAFLRSGESALNSERADRIAKEAKKKKKTAVVFATHKFMGQKELTGMGIVFCGFPYGV